MRTPNPLRLVALLASLVLVGGAAWLLVPSAPGPTGTGGPDGRALPSVFPDCPTGSPEECATGAPRTGVDARGAGRTAIPASEACVDAGYLCAPLRQADSTLVLHFPPGTGTLRVRIPVPPDEDGAEARRLQRAAARGIQAWQGHPFQLRILERDRSETADITVRWMPRVEGGALGRTSLRYRSGPGGTEYRVVALRLATRIPSRPDQAPESRALELTAAHEMGHALGLPHSEDPRDLMYPTNTATHPTARDYRTLDALYRIPSGTGIVRD